MAKSTINGHFQQRTVSLPEGIRLYAHNMLPQTGWYYHPISGIHPTSPSSHLQTHPNVILLICCILLYPIICCLLYIQKSQSLILGLGQLQIMNIMVGILSHLKFKDIQTNTIYIYIYICIPANLCRLYPPVISPSNGNPHCSYVHHIVYSHLFLW